MAMSNSTYSLNDCPAGFCQDDHFGPVNQIRTFDFTLLFEQSVLSLLPSSIFILSTSLLLFGQRKQARKTLQHPIARLKLGITAIYAVLQLAALVLVSSSRISQVRTSITAYIFSFIGSLAVLFLGHDSQKKSYRPSTILTVYLLGSILFDAVQIRSLFYLESKSLAGVLTASCAVRFCLCVLELRNKRSYLIKPYDSYPVEVTSNAVSRSLFWWLNHVFFDGFRKLLTVDDLSEVDVELRSEALGQHMQQAWSRQSSSGRKNALAWASFLCLWRPILWAVPARLCLVGLNYAQPFLISRAVTVLSEETSDASKREGYGLIGATLLIYTSLAICSAQYRHQVYRTLTMFRGAMVALIYDHALSLPDGLHMESPALTLMSTDIDSIIESLVHINEIWANVIEVAIGVALLAIRIGAVCLVPIGLTIICSLAQTKVAKKIGPCRQEWNKVTQKRVAATSTVLTSLKSARIMGLAEILAAKLQAMRVDELKTSGSFMWMVVALNLLAWAPTAWAPSLTFVTFAVKAAVQGRDSLSTSETFSALAILTLVTRPAAGLLASIPLSASSLGCFARIQTYLLVSKREDSRVTTERQSASSFSGTGIELDSLTTSSISSNSAILAFKSAAISPATDCGFKVTGLDFEVARKSFTMVLGPTGCGKTTLLKAMIGEAYHQSGNIEKFSTGSAFCAQTPWLPNTTLQQAICGPFSTVDIDQEWYARVVYACALDTDILNSHNGDQTILGSTGSMLSGGQKQRMTLARAIYAKKELIILDDILSALDANTEQLVVERLLGANGLLRRSGVTLVFATHNVKHARLFDQLIVLNRDGTLEHVGPPKSIPTDSQILKDLDTDLSPSPEIIESSKPSPPSDQSKDLTRRTGDFTLYKYYMKSFGAAHATLFLVTYIGHAFTKNFSIIWLEWWTRGTTSNLGVFLSIYILLAFAATSFNGATMWTSWIRIMPRSAVSLHKVLLTTVLGATQQFLDTTDSGELLNRFSQDMSFITMPLIVALHMAGTHFFNCVAQLALIATGSSYMAITIPFLLIALYFVQDVYLRTSRQLRILDLESRSPLYAHFVDTIDGLATIRAFGWANDAKRLNIDRLDISQKPFYMLNCVQRWLQLVLDLLVAALAVAVMVLAMTLRSSTTGGLLGVAMNNLLSFNQALGTLVVGWTSLETSLGAIARIRSFERSTPQEDDSTPESKIPGANWPGNGAIKIENATAVYNETTVALDKINIDIAPGQRIGICGRTGSGKTSLFNALLRLLPLTDGKIFIDGIDIKTLRSSSLRSRIMAIPQDVATFEGTLGWNVDPNELATNDQIVDVLRRVGLWTVLEPRGGLEADMKSTGLSKGQHQLLALARALLHRCKIVLLDESTSSLDAETDHEVQRVIREELKDCTLITIAHRLQTILESDKILVMSEGKVVEYESPGKLLSRSSQFKRLCEVQKVL